MDDRAAPLLGSATAGSLTKAGIGNLVLTGASTFTGNTVITGGTLQIAGSGSLGGGTYNGFFTNNGALLYTSSATQALGGIISGIGSLTTTGPLTLGAIDTYAGGTFVDAGTLTIGTAGQLLNAAAAGPLYVASGAMITSNSTVAAQNPLGWQTATSGWTVAGTINMTAPGEAQTLPNFGSNTPVILNGGTLTSSATANTTVFGYYYANGATIIANGNTNQITAANVGMAPGGLVLNTPLSTDTLRSHPPWAAPSPAARSSAG